MEMKRWRISALAISGFQVRGRGRRCLQLHAAVAVVALADSSFFHFNFYKFTVLRRHVLKLLPLIALHFTSLNKYYSLRLILGVPIEFGTDFKKYYKRKLMKK